MLGARVEIIRNPEPGTRNPESGSLWRRVRSDGSYASASDPRVLGGLGHSTRAPRVRVRWPGGTTEEWSAVDIDRYTTLKEGDGK
jgi:enediyne biosynthesis protein E4